jgi:hypothetical protein
MTLYTVAAASILSLVVGIAAGERIAQVDGQGLAYWCGEIASEKRVQREIFHDMDSDPVSEECDAPQVYAEAYAKGDGTSARITWLVDPLELVSSFLSKSWASTPQ